MIFKTLPEDFLVDELPLEDMLSSSTQGKYCVYKLTKKNYATERALTHLASFLGLQRKQISIAGTKDKHAITTQYVTIKGPKIEKSIDLTDIDLEFVGYRDEPLGLGDLAGNKFTIIVRGLDAGVNNIPASFYSPNYFDEQRFSTHNVVYGLFLLKKQYKELVDAIISNEDDYARSVKQYLEDKPTDYVGAIRTMPASILKMFIHAVQSMVFNESLRTYIAEQYDHRVVVYSQGEFAFPKDVVDVYPDVQLHLIGYTTRFSESENAVLAKHELTRSSFLLKTLPFLTAEGEDREGFIQVTHVVVEPAGNDDLHEGKLKQKISFSLPKSAYATIVLKQLYE